MLPYFLRAQDKAFLSNSSKVSPLSGFPENFESSLLAAFVMAEDFDYYQFTEHCEFVYDMLCLDSVKNADSLYSTPKFWPVKWQLENRQRQYEKLFCFLETICEGEAERQLQAQGVEKTMGMRKHFFERFGSGQPQVLQERVRKYLLGMPDKHGVAFASRVNMPDKLDQPAASTAFFESCA